MAFSDKRVTKYSNTWSSHTLVVRTWFLSSCRINQSDRLQYTTTQHIEQYRDDVTWASFVHHVTFLQLVSHISVKQTEFNTRKQARKPTHEQDSWFKMSTILNTVTTSILWRGHTFRLCMTKRVFYIHKAYPFIVIQNEHLMRNLLEHMVCQHSMDSNHWNTVMI